MVCSSKTRSKDVLPVAYRICVYRKLYDPLGWDGAGVRSISR